jgi:hypothetical protein
VDPGQLASMRVRSSRDIAGLELLLGWAKELRLARVHRGRLVSVRQHRRLLDEEAVGQLQLWRLAVAVETAQLLSHLQGLGMVEPAHGTGSDGEPGGAEVVRDNGAAFAGPADAYLSALARLPLRLTPLGTWQANVLLRAAGAVAPVIGELPGTDAAEAEVRRLLADPGQTAAALSIMLSVAKML